jgi:Cu(I)/Ag(I) efflux system membrane fusion protein
MRPVLAGYLVVQETLAADSLERVEETATAIADAAAKLDAADITGEHTEHYRSLPATIASASYELAKASTIEAARDAFKGLSRPMAIWATMSAPAGIDVVFCPMANANWLQTAGDIKNPYYGSGMLACGEVVGGGVRAQ